MVASEPKPAVWDDALLRDPHAAPDKRTRVQRMFAAIAPSYDLNNRLHSLWLDQAWRRKAVKLATLRPDDQVLDVACGTGDLTLKFAAALGSLRRGPLAPAQVTGLDFTFEMLPLARSKASSAIRQSAIGNRQSPIPFINADALRLPFPDASFDVLSIAFGIRNVADPAAAIREFARVLRPGGRLMILEFSLPTNPLLRALYNFYFRQVLPRTATLLARDRTGAYKYLPESVNTFIGRQQMLALARSAGFSTAEAFPLTFGVCVCYRAVKSLSTESA